MSCPSVTTGARTRRGRRSAGKMAWPPSITSFAAISDANLPAFGTQLSIAMTLYSSDNTLTSSIDGVSFNYDGNLINRNKTKDYVIEMPSTTAIRVTAPSSGGPRNARVYVSS